MWPSTLPLKELGDYSPLSFIISGNFTCIFYHYPLEILHLEKKIPETITCYVFKKQTRQTHSLPLLSVSWRRNDISSCLLQLSRLPFGLGHSVSKCVFCVRCVQGFGTCCGCQQGDSHPSQRARLQEAAWWLPASSAGHIQPQPGSAGSQHLPQLGDL